jgi:hypothetical protein
MRGTLVEDRLRKELRQYGKIREINAYAEQARFPEKLRAELQRSGIHLIDTPHLHSKETADHMIISDIFVFAIHNPAPQSVVLISGDGGFAYCLAKLRQMDYQIILVAPPSGTSMILRETADVIFEWSEMMSLEGDDIEEPTLRFDPLLTTLRDLIEGTEGNTTLLRIGEHLLTRYPTWTRSAGVESIEEYIDEAENRGLVTTWLSNGVRYIQIAEDEEGEIEVAESEMTRLEPLLEVLNQLSDSGDDAPELAQIGITLRTLMPDPLETLEVKRLKDYVLEAEEAGLVTVRQDGLQHYVSLVKVSEREPPDVEENLILDLLERALDSLGGDAILPTGTSLLGRMRQLQPGWTVRRSPFGSLKNLLQSAMEKRGIIIEAEMPYFIIFPKSGKFECVDPSSDENPYGIAQWVAFSQYLLETSDVWVKGRYHFAKRIHDAKIPGLSDLKLGHIIHMVQLARNMSILGWKIGVPDSFVPIESNIEVLLENWKDKLSDS